MNAHQEKLERIAIDYHTNANVPDIHIENLCQEYFIQWLVSRVAPHLNVLELGYGDGLVTAALVDSGCKLTLIEGARVLVDRARAEHPGIECVHTLFEEYRPARGFDLVLASHVLEHVDSPQSLLRLFRTWLNPGGRLMIVVPNCNSVHRQLAVAMGLQPALDTLSKRDELVGHQRVYSLERLVDDVEAVGLEVAESRGFFLKVLPNSMMLDYSRELLWALNTIAMSMPADILANISVVAVNPTPKASNAPQVQS